MSPPSSARVMAAGAGPPEVVLGLCASTSSSAAALLIGGRLVGCVEAEHLSGETGADTYPEQAVNWLLTTYGLAPSRVTAVAVSSGSRLIGERAATSRPSAVLRNMAGRPGTRARNLLRSAAAARQQLALVKRRFPLAEVQAVRHDLAQGLNAYLASGFPRSAVLVVDSAREGISTTISIAEGPWLRPAVTLRERGSLGCAQSAITEQLGFPEAGEEAAALAATGDPARFRPVFQAAIRLHDRGISLSRRSFQISERGPRSIRVTSDFARRTCPPREAHGPLDRDHADLAAALQERTEEALVHLASLAVRLTGDSRLCLGGGLALNSAGVGRIVAAAAFEEVFVPPAPGDSGTAIGAAAAVARRRGPLLSFDRSGFLGPSYGVERIARAAAAAGRHAQWVDDPATFLAGQLAAGRVVGVFHGRAETGPRPAGNRSLLASPLVAGMTDRINNRSKSRELFGVPGTVVLAGRVSEWFQLDQEFPFVPVAVPVTAQAGDLLAAVVARNGLVRVQTVGPAHNALLAATLEAFAARTGVPVLAITSLSVHDQPIAATPELALRCLRDVGGLDGLMLENWWVAG